MKNYFPANLALAAIALSTLAACTRPAPAGWQGYLEGEFVYVAAPLAGRLDSLAVAKGTRVAADAPLSTDAARWVDDQAKAPTAVAALATGGDDYELVFTCAPKSLDSLVSAAPEVHVIGRVSDGEGVAVTYNGEPLALARSGYQHG